MQSFQIHKLVHQSSIKNGSLVYVNESKNNNWEWKCSAYYNNKHVT